jgi:hypothetical protein
MSYTFHPASDIGKVRLLIGDNIENQGALPEERNFSDEEVQVFLDRHDANVDMAAAELLLVLARNWARVADTTIGPLKQSFSAVARAYERQASSAMERQGMEGVSFMARFERDDGYAAQAAAEESEV